MKIGNFEVHSVPTGLFHLDGGAVFGIVPRSIWSKKYHAPDEKNLIELAAAPLLVKTGNRNILIDTGNGDKWNEKQQALFGINCVASNAENYLKPFNLKAEDITDVILTHLHFDHAGGATRIDAGQIVPTFPNAKYYTQAEQLHSANNPNDKEKASYMRENWQCLEDNGMLVKLDGEQELLPGLKLLPVYGHTNAMQIVRIQSQGESLLFCGDLVPTSGHIQANYYMGYDNYPLTVIEEKKRILGQALEEKTKLYFQHDAYRPFAELGYSNGKFCVEDIMNNLDR